MAEGRTKWPPVEDDWFVEPTEATRFLLEREDFTGMTILDPACGQGNVVVACRAAGLTAYGTDLRERAGAVGERWFLGAADYIERPAALSVPHAIICNPPYGRAKLAEAFIRKSVELYGIRKVAMFVNAKFLFGAGRAKGLYRDHPPTRIWPVTPRPSCPPGQFLLDGGKAEGGVENFVWLVFCPQEPRAPSQFLWDEAAPVAEPQHPAPPMAEPRERRGRT